MLPGGISDKLGNEYERKWAVRNLLCVMDATATAIRYENVSADLHGFEFELRQANHSEWHQTKINAPHGNWTLYRLNKEGLLDAMKQRLSVGCDDHCVFVSQDPSKQLRELCDQARMASNVHELLNTLSKKGHDAFEELEKIWAVDSADAFSWLRRCEFRTESRQSIERAIADHGAYLLRGDADFYAILSTYLIDHLNSTITTEIAHDWIRTHSPFTFVHATLDKTLPERVNSANRRYLASYTPFGMGGQCVSRAQAADVLDALRDVDVPSLILLTGPAGTGKSGVVREVMAELKAGAIPHLAFRLDRCLSRETRTEIGSFVLERSESPVSVLSNLAAGGPAVLIVDQIDAVSEVSGRTAAAKDVLFQLVRETQRYGDVKCVLVCRTFDLENDLQYRDLVQTNKARTVEVTRLSWIHDVVPVLEHAEVGTDDFDDSQRELLTLPLNLAIFLEIGDPSFSFATGTALMKGLLDKKTRDLINGHTVPWSIQDPLFAIANWMSDNQELSCPDSVLDHFDGAKNWLASEGLIALERNRVAFFHESFFDFIFARAFAQSERDIAEFLTSTEQHLFRRTQVRQILTLMRDTDRARYLGSLESILSFPVIRLHIKLAVAQWLASLANPMLDELTVIQKLDDSGKPTLRLIRKVSSWLKSILGHPDHGDPFPLIVRKALFESETWFNLMNDTGQLSKLLNTSSQSQQRTLLWWMNRTATKHPEQTVVRLREWWNSNPDRNNQLVDWFGALRTIPQNHALASLLLDLINAAPAASFTNEKLDRTLRQLPDLANAEPRIVSDVLIELLASWFQRHPGRHPFRLIPGSQFDIDYLSKLAQAAPAVFLDGMIPALIRSTELSNDQEFTNRIHVLYGTRDSRGPDALFSLYRSALQTLAKTSPTDAERRLDRLDPALHKVLLHLHLETIAASPSALGHRFPALVGDPGIFSAGMENAEWKCYADAARSLIAANAVPRNLIEDSVFDHRPELVSATAIAHENNQAGNTEGADTRYRVLRRLKRSGHVQWCVLRTIGRDLLSPRAKKRLAELDRKFSDELVPKPRVYEAKRVDSPISDDATSKMTDEQWLSAIHAYDDKTGVAEHRLHFQFGAASAFAQQLDQAAKSDPDRFARFFCRLPSDTNPTYGQHVLQGLANADGVSLGPALAALRAAHAHSNRPFGLQFVRVIQRHRECVQHDDIFRALLWYAEHGDTQESLVSDSAEDEANEFPSINNLLQARSSLIVNGTNCARGLAWELLAQLLDNQPHRANRIWTLLERRVREETSNPVRAAFAYALVPLSSQDTSRFAGCIRNLIEPVDGERDDEMSLSPLATHVGFHLFSPIERDLPDLAFELMRRMTTASDKTLQLLGAWWSMTERFRTGNSKRRFRRIHRRSPAHTALWAAILSEIAPITEFRNFAIQELKRLFRHNVLEVRTSAAFVFQNIPPDEFVYFVDMARAFVRSPAFGNSAHSMIRALEDASCDVTELVLETGEEIVRRAGNHGSYWLFAIQQVLKREYVNSETRPKLRTRFLDLIDNMAAKNLPDADDLMRLDDRSPI